MPALRRQPRQTRVLLLLLLLLPVLWRHSLELPLSQQRRLLVTWLRWWLYCWLHARAGSSAAAAARGGMGARRRAYLLATIIIVVVIEDHHWRGGRAGSGPGAGGRAGASGGRRARGVPGSGRRRRQLRVVTPLSRDALLGVLVVRSPVITGPERAFRGTPEWEGPLADVFAPLNSLPGPCRGTKRIV